MQKRIDPGPALSRLAEAQAGVVTAGQAETLGLGRHSRQRLLRCGRWRRLEDAVLVVHPFELEWLGYAWAGVLLGGDHSRLAGAAAGHLHGLSTVPPSAIELLTRAPVRDRGRWRFRRERVGMRSASRGSPPRTGLEDTVLDLSQYADVSEIVGWVTQAVQTHRTSADRLRRALNARTRHSRRAVLNELLGDVDDGVRSPLELRYRTDVERAHGLPQGTRQHRSRRRHLRDVVYQEQQTVVELDGRIGHEGLGRFRDMARDNVATLQGEVTLRYGFADVAGTPCAVAAQVAVVLQTRGWTGGPQRCPRCSAVPEADLA